MRRTAPASGMINIDNLTDHQWLKLMEAQEAGQEYNVPHPKKRRRSVKDEVDDDVGVGGDDSSW